MVQGSVSVNDKNWHHVAVSWDDGTNTTQEGTTVLAAGKWYHAALTYDGSTIRLYLDGVEEGNWPEASLSTASADNFEIGAGGSTRYFDGVLDDVRLYNRGLCATEVTAIFEEARGIRIVSWQEVEPNQEPASQKPRALENTMICPRDPQAFAYESTCF